MLRQSKSIKKMLEDISKDMKAKVPTGSGNLKNSIRPVVTNNGGYVEMLEYGLYVDAGVNGIYNNRGSIYSYTDKMPPIEAMVELGNRIGANPFALQTSIYRKGFKGYNFIDPDKTDRIIERGIDEYGNEIINYIIDENT